MRPRTLALLILAAALGLRLAMVFLPVLGRDEVTYLYWSHHPRVDYAPLLQLQIFLARLISDAPWFLRSTQLLVGAMSMLGLAAWLKARKVPDPLLAVAAVSVTPWLVFSGSVLHPDGLFVLGLMVFALGTERGRPALVVTGAIISLGAKLTGVVPVTVALYWLFHHRHWRSLAALGVFSAGFALLLRPETLGAARDFGRIGGSPGLRLLVLVLETLLIGGVLVLVPRVSRWRATTVTGLIIVVGFAVMAVVEGQTKANWLLPGLLLLWPLNPDRRVLFGGALVALGLSAMMVTGYRNPTIAGTAESALRTRSWLPEYRLLAGEREARVASATSWTGYLAGFHGELPVLPLPDQVQEVRSDDYALAARFALRCPDPVPVIVVPGDPLFDREPEPAPGRRLIVAVRVPLAELTGDATVVWRGSVAHPVTGSRIQLALVEEIP